MVGCETIARSMHHIQPIWSNSQAEARTRVIKLYKSWFREIPHIVDDYNLPLTTRQCRDKLHANFLKQKHLSDIHQIDTLVMKHQQQLKALRFRQMDRAQLLNKLAKESEYGAEPTLQRTQFLAKFLVA